MEQDAGLKETNPDIGEEQKTQKLVVDAGETIAAGADLSNQKQASSIEGQNQIIAEKYLILEKLGSGGLSSVYKVKHLHLDRIYALKLLHELKEESILRFQQEAKAASMLQHQNIISVVDFGVSNAMPYMVMNCVEGQTLGKYAKQMKPVEPRKCIKIFGQICAALAHAHEKGVVHRDIKPSNIMISMDESGQEQAMVVDFGIAKVLGEQPDGFNAQLTRTGDIFGTPLYMSPEQCKGMAVDARSDIYSLACVFYEVLTGEAPFPGDSPYEIIHKQITEAPKPFSQALRRTPLVSKLEALILKAMAKAPEDRFQYMLEMSSAIKAVELGSRTPFSLSGLNLAMARFKASDKQQNVFKLGIGFSSVLCVLFTLVIAFFPPEIDRLSKAISMESEIIARIKSVFTFRYDPGASLFRLKRSDIKVKLANIRRLAKLDQEISAGFQPVAKLIMVAADKVHELRGVERGLYSGELSSIQERVKAIEFQLGDVSNSWAEANDKSVDLSNQISRRIEIQERKLSLMTAALMACRILILPVFGLMCFSLFMIFASRRKAKMRN